MPSRENRFNYELESVVKNYVNSMSFITDLDTAYQDLAKQHVPTAVICRVLAKRPKCRKSDKRNN